MHRRLYKLITDGFHVKRVAAEGLSEYLHTCIYINEIDWKLITIFYSMIETFLITT